MSVEVQILDSEKATTEGFLSWVQLYGTRHHLPTAHPSYWQSLRNLAPGTKQHFAFVYQYSQKANSRKKAPIGILPFQVSGGLHKQQETPKQSSAKQKIQWLRAKRNSGPKTVITFSDDFFSGGGPIGSQPTATLMATLRFLQTEYSQQTEWRFHLGSDDPSLRSRVDTVLKQFPSRSTKSTNKSIGWILSLNKNSQLLSELSSFAIEPLKISRTLGDQEVFYHQNDYLLIGSKRHPIETNSQRTIHLSELLVSEKKTPSRLFIPFSSLQTNTDQLKLDNLIKKHRNSSELQPWLRTETVSGPPSVWQKLFSPRFAGL